MPEPESDGFMQYFRLLKRRKGTLLLTAFLGVLVAFLLTIPQTPVYRAQTLLEVENLNEDFLNMKNASPTLTTPGMQAPEYNIKTYTTVLQSRPVLERAMKDLKPEDRSALMGDQTVKPSSNKISWRKTLGLRQPLPPAPGEQAMEQLSGALKVTNEPHTRVITVTFDSTDAELAATFTNSIAGAFIQHNLENRWKTSQDTVEWLSRRMQDVKSKLRKSEEDLQRMASAANLTFIGEKDNVSEDRLRQLQAEVLKAREEAVNKQSAYEMVATSSPDALPDVLNDATLKDYQVELTKFRRDLAEFSSLYTPQNPKVTKVQAHITELEAALNKKRANIVERIKNEYTAAQRREKLLSADYGSQLGLISKQSDKVAQYSILKREVDTNRNLYDSMLQRVSEAGFASAMRESDIRVIEQARIPTLPYKPDFVLNSAFGLISGLFFGIALVILRAGSDRRIQQPGDTTLHLNVPELGVIPASGSMRKLFSKAGNGLAPNGDTRLELTTWQQWPSVLAESFRLTLASILCSEQNGARPRVIVLSSANPGEGKTTVISNLAIALAQAGNRVLLIDGDMRKPRLHDIFDVANTAGLSDVLTGKSTPAVLETKIHNLFLMPSGKGGSGALNALFTPQLRSLLRRLKSEFDMILIDTPPMLHIPDARLLGRQADAVIIVVAQNTSRDVVGTACQRLGEDGTKLLGTILNNWNPKDGRGYSDYQSYYKAYHSQEA